MIVALTGHRPPKGGLTYSHAAQRDLEVVEITRQWLVGHDVEVVISGGALGFDTLGARAAYLAGIPYDVYIPHVDHSSNWPKEAQERYMRMLDHARWIELVTDEPYRRELMQVRNERMVDEADHILAFWDGSDGGTANCLRYAVSQRKTGPDWVTNIHG